MKHDTIMKTTQDHSRFVPQARLKIGQRLWRHILKTISLALMFCFHAQAEGAIVSSGVDDNGATTLRTLINQAQPGDTIVFASTLSTITVTLGEIVINKNL